MEQYKILKRIIRGDLQPHKISINDLSILQNEFQIPVEIIDNELIIKEHRYLSILSNKNVTIKLEQDNLSLIITEDDYLEELIDINIPPADDEKSQLYLRLIEFEYEFILLEIKSFIENVKDTKDLELFGLKNIYELKELAKDVYNYGKRIPQKGNYPYEPNEYVVIVLKQYLIYLIVEIQDIFSKFCPISIKIENEDRLKSELYFDNLAFDISLHPILSILPKLPKENRYKKHKELFLKYNKESKNLSKNQRMSFGEFAFKFYKEEFKTDVSHYKREKLFWEQLLITNKLKVRYIDKYINHPEIEKILVPLLNSEINHLENRYFSKNSFSFEKLTVDIIEILVKMSKRVDKKELENVHNDFLSDFLQERGYYIDNQSRVGNKLIDIEIQKEKGSTICIIEGLKLSYLNRTYIYEHIYKLLNEYDKTGNAVNYIIVYSESKNHLTLWKDYFTFLHELNDYEKGLVYIIDSVNDRSAETGKSDIFFAETVHKRNNQKSSIYHIMIKMNKYY